MIGPLRAPDRFVTCENEEFEELGIQLGSRAIEVTNYGIDSFSSYRITASIPRGL
jgi:hypothetical protein